MNDFETRFKMVSSLASNQEIDVSLSYYNGKWVIKADSHENPDYQKYAFEVFHKDKDACINDFIPKFKKSLLSLSKDYTKEIGKNKAKIFELEDSIRAEECFIKDVEITINTLDEI